MTLLEAGKFQIDDAAYGWISALTHPGRRDFRNAVYQALT